MKAGVKRQVSKGQASADCVSLRQLAYLVAIAEHGKITVAAAKLGMSQSTLSQQIGELERGVGAQLLVRRAGGVELTEPGRVLVDRARAILSGVRQAVSAARAAAGIESTQVRVGSLLTISQQLLPPVIQAWARTHEHVEIIVRSYRNYRLLAEAVSAGEVNVAVGARPDQWTGGLKSLGWEEFVIVTTADDVTMPDPVPVADLADRRWIHYEGADNGLGLLLDAVCARAGFRPTVAVRGPHTDAAIAYAAAGLAIAFVPAGAVPPGTRVRVVRPLPAVRREIAVYSTDGPSSVCPCGRRLIDCIARPIGKLPGK